MSPETADESGDPARQETVYVVMSENSGGVAGMVCATRMRAENELRAILAEYTIYDAAGSRQYHSPEAIQAMIEESRGATINPYRDDWYWIDVCPVHA